MTEAFTIRFNGRLYKKDGTRWYCDSRKKWRPVYDAGRIEVLNKLERGHYDTTQKS